MFAEVLSRGSLGWLGVAFEDVSTISFKVTWGFTFLLILHELHRTVHCNPLLQHVHISTVTYIFPSGNFSHLLSNPLPPDTDNAAASQRSANVQEGC